MIVCTLFASDEEEEHGEEDKGEVDEFCLEVRFLEYHCSEEEGDDDAATAYHGDDADHGVVHAKGVEIGKVGSGEEYGDEDDAPIPMEWGGLLACRIPEEKEHEEHHEELVDVVP